MTVPNEQGRSGDRLNDPRPAAQQETVELTQDQIEALQAALAAAEQRALESKDLYMRALAEMENIRKRAARDVEQAQKFAVERFANELVGVKDSLELGLESTGDAQALKQGTEATLKLLAKAFESAGIVEIDPRGDAFNPELHEAMAVQPSAEHVPNTVLQVVQKGYQLNGRLLRPARVIVVKEG